MKIQETLTRKQMLEYLPFYAMLKDRHIESHNTV